MNLANSVGGYLERLLPMAPTGRVFNSWASSGADVNLYEPLKVSRTLSVSFIDDS